jgi:hypothetical protein
MEPQVALIDRDIWPDSRHQLLLAHNFAGAFDKNDKNVEGSSTQMNWAARLLKVSVRWAQAKWTERNRVRSSSGLFVSHLHSLKTTGTGKNRGRIGGFQWNDRCHVKAWLRSESPESGTAGAAHGSAPMVKRARHCRRPKSLPMSPGRPMRVLVRRTAVALADRRRVQQARGLIALDDIDGAAGRLLGMVASAARRHLRRPVSAGRVRKSKRGSAPVQRYFYGAAKCKEFKEFAAAEAALARGKVGFYPPHAR